MADMLSASDVLDIDWNRIAQDKIDEGVRREAQRLLREMYSMKAPELHVPAPSEPVEIREKNVVTDPDSWLNRGLNRMAGDAASVILGEPSGNDLVDMGVANVPLAGAGAILAAGGMPGIVDVIPGAGELKNIAKIPKYTLEFVTKHFGERGLRNLDNALTKYPKAGKPSVNDAVYIMRSGLGGEKVKAIMPYSSNDTMGDVAAMMQISKEKMNERIREGYNVISTADGGAYKEVADQALAKMNRAAEKGDIGTANAYASMIIGPGLNPVLLNETLSVLKKPTKNMNAPIGDFYRFNTATPGGGWNPETMRLIKELYESPLQDWEKIAAAQERKDARDAEKAIKKAARQQPVKPVVKQEAQKEARAIEASPDPAPATVVDVPEVSSVEPVKVGGPNKWRENGWKSSQYSPNFYERFGSRLDENTKRDLFVLDSLKNHWVRQLGDPENRGFSAAEILNGFERSGARHNKTNYNQISREFRKDIERNIASGNMPGTSIEFKQQFKNNTPVEGRTTPTLMLRMDEKPKVFLDPRVWADEAEGPDLYELLFRPAVDRKLNSLNPRYWEY